jgi:hypothetical protein
MLDSCYPLAEPRQACSAKSSSYALTVADGIVRLIGEGAIKLLPLHTTPMRTSASLYHRHRFPVEIISHCVWLYFRFNLSFHDVEDPVPVVPRFI